MAPGTRAKTAQRSSDETEDRFFKVSLLLRAKPELTETLLRSSDEVGVSSRKLRQMRCILSRLDLFLEGLLSKGYRTGSPGVRHCGTIRPVRLLTGEVFPLAMFRNSSRTTSYGGCPI